MRAAMASAPVGDDVFGEDPTVNALEARMCEESGKEAAVFMPSGTMSNLCAIMAHCDRRGSEVILGDQSHIFLYEQAGLAALAGASPHTVPTAADGTLAAESIRSAVRDDDVHYPVTRLLCLENTHNRCGGAVLDAAYMEGVGALAGEIGIPLHVDGARIYNAALALGVPVRDLCAAADSVSICLSKGLGAPVGSVLVGREETMAKARRARKALGGGLRQSGVLAAGALYALDHSPDKMRRDHENARRLEEGLRALGFEIVAPAATNILYFRMPQGAFAGDSEAFAARLAEEGVLIGGGYGDGHVCRAVCNIDVSGAALDGALHAFSKVLTDRQTTTLAV